MSRAAIFLDRDGVLNDPVPDGDGPPESPYHPEDVHLSTGAVEGARALRAAGFALVVVTNQPAAAKGTATVAALMAVNSRVREVLADAAVELDGWYTCLHHPAGTVPELSGPCDCRKPAAGMLLQAARELDLDLAASWIVGDSDSDVGAGERAGVRTALVEHPGSAHRRSDLVAPDVRAADLAEAAAAIVAAA
ncbi:HAD family hydrolase [Solirubrobacter phytolaccae]|uniref:D,D-heptose 1,7-bisphosphate phosphatase n=1 Tax=Solirubrobacter phytolaccae TaxID=1404360 RepID=A0A9X3NC58_9ACTN|nr:HAD family hydrolase [Solirubrobacter phytolaccae]MDA0182379.1 HAD family hydrolase [Solirubrobacter phytolaccae]